MARKMCGWKQFQYLWFDHGELLVRVRTALTCGTDVKVFRRGYHALDDSSARAVSVMNWQATLWRWARASPLSKLGSVW